MSFSFPVREAVQGFSPYSPGRSIEEIQQQYGLAHVIKMASNENPLGTPPLAIERVQAAASGMYRYLQSGAPALVAAVSKFFHVPQERIVLGNGSDEVIDLLIRACPTPGKHTVVTCQPCFSLYTLQSTLCDVALRQVPLREDFSFDWQGLRQAVDETTALVFITTPDNPTGYCPKADEVRAFAQSLPAGCLLVIDEAYMDFTQDEQEFSLLKDYDAFPQLVFLRTFSKSFGLAGIRLGFGVMRPDLAKMLCNIRPPFSVNSLAEVAAIAAMEDRAFREKTFAVVAQGRAYLQQQLSLLACEVTPSLANFVLFALPSTCAMNAQEVGEALLKQGIIVRPATSYGLTRHVRVSVGTTQENEAFIAALKKVLK